MSTNATELEGLADRISDTLGPIHRGAIWIGPGKLAVFGNDGYGSGDGRAVREAERMRAWLTYKGWNPSDTQASSEDGYTWVIVAECHGVRKGREVADARLWRVWRAVNGPAPADNFQRAAAAREIDGIGGGYTDATLATPLKGKGGRVRGSSLVGDMMLAQSEGNEDVHLLLGGIPYPARAIAMSSGPGAVPIGVKLEAVVLTESVGDPRSESGNPADAYLPAGQVVVVRDFGERHPTTGRRVVVPVHPGTGEALPD